jgi:hypothetical protein
MTQGITYRTRSHDFSRDRRRASGPVARAGLARLRAALGTLWRGWPRWMPELPASLVDDVAPMGAHRAHAEIQRLDARLGVRLY